MLLNALLSIFVHFELGEGSLMSCQLQLFLPRQLVRYVPVEYAAGHIPEGHVESCFFQLLTASFSCSGRLLLGTKIFDLELWIAHDAIISLSFLKGRVVVITILEYVRWHLFLL